VIASRRDTGRSSCSSRLAGAFVGEAGWSAKLLLQLAGLMSMAESAAARLLAASLLRCCLDVSVAVTGASVSDVRLFILLSLGGAHEPMDVGAAMVSADLVSLPAL
jgi:hypothetical protein